MKRSVVRLVLVPVVVLLVAVALKIRSDRESEMRRAAIYVLSESWCAAAAGGEDLQELVDRLPTAEPLLGPLVGRAIADVCGSNPDALVDLEFGLEVGLGVAPQGGHAQSSHYAMFRTDGAPQLVLSFARRNDQTVIIGYWTPGDG